VVEKSQMANHKLQITNPKKITNYKSQITKQTHAGFSLFLMAAQAGVPKPEAWQNLAGG